MRIFLKDMTKSVFFLFRIKKIKKKKAIAGILSKEEQGLFRKIEQIKHLSSGSLAKVEYQDQELIEKTNLVHLDEFQEYSCSNFKIEQIESFDQASVAQIYKAKAFEAEYAIKTISKEVEQSLTSDSEILSKLVSVFGTFKKGFDLDPFKAFFKQEAKNEVDLNREFEIQTQFYEFFKNTDIIIAKPLKKAKDKNSFMMTFEDSLNLDLFYNNSNDFQKHSCQKLIEQFYMDSLLKLRYIHTDPNPGNFGFRIENQKVKLVVYDFGSVAKIEESQLINFLKWTQITKENQLGSFDCLSLLGFNSIKLTAIKSTLGALSKVLLAPFISQGRFDLNSWKRSDKIKDVLGEYRFQFMTSAPIEMFPWMRAFKGLFFYSEKFSGTTYLLPYLQKAYLKYERQLKDLVLKEDAIENTALFLKIALYVDEVKKVALEFPAMAIESIEDLMDQKMLNTLLEKGISVEEIKTKARKNSYKAMEIFSWREENKELIIELS